MYFLKDLKPELIDLLGLLVNTQTRLQKLNLINLLQFTLATQKEKRGKDTT